MIESLDERNGNNKLTEIRMRNAENEKMKSFKKLYDFEIQVEHLKKEIAVLKSKVQDAEEEKEFYHQNALETQKKL